MNLTLLTLLLALNLLVTAVRSGLLNTHYASLLALQNEPGDKVTRTIDLVNQRARLRSSLRLIQSVLRLLIAGIVLDWVAAWLGGAVQNQTAAWILLFTAILIWFSEFVVERFIMRHPETWAIRLTPLASIFVGVVSPLLALPFRLFGMSTSGADQLVTVTEDELKSLVDASQREGVIEQEEHKMISSIFQFGDTIAREIMVPRIDMLTLDVHTPLGEAADAVLDSGYSRVPVYEEQIDNIVGLLYTKDMLKVWRAGNEVASLRSLLRPANFIPETKKVDDLLAEMQAAHIHIAIVVDEYGGVAGLVTLEDIVEEIFGEIQDEYDEGEELPYQKIQDGEYVFRGRIDLDDLNTLMNSHLDTDEADTLGGLIYNRLGRVPKIGESFQEDNLLLTIEQVTSRRIRKVRAQRLPTKNIDEKKEHHNAD
ncbi:MAG: hemolysin family protein [Anaerolineae bacterium]|nr:hemolysin family protein [Anaerolineae bacterium]